MIIIVNTFNYNNIDYSNIKGIKFSGDSYENLILEVLYKCPDIEYLDISQTDISILPILSKLTYLDCSECKLLKQIPLLPSLTSLYCNKSGISSIANLPNLEYLSCCECDLKSLLILPKLVSLNVAYCIRLEAIPILPNLNSMNCNNCYNLKEIPILPKLTNLDCHSCYKITTIPVLAELVELNCYQCDIKSIPNLHGLVSLCCRGNGGLDFIGNLYNLEILNCSECYGLTSIKNVRNLKRLNVRFCNIASLPLDLYNLEILDCISCEYLANIPIYENLIELDVKYCKSLTKLPILPNLKKLEFEMSAVELNTVPIKFLETYSIDLLRQCLEYNQLNVNYIHDDYIKDSDLLTLLQENPELLNICDSEHYEWFIRLFTKYSIDIPFLVKPCKDNLRI
jgi:Leucine-rich repeat (LRR) protein